MVVWGPAALPDTQGYIAFAQRILEDGRWLGDAGLDAAPMPLTAFRIIGYPVLVAAAKVLSQAHWDWILILTQICVFTISLIAFALLVVRAGLKKGFAAFCVIATGLSLSWTLDQSLLTDSLFSSLFVIVLSTLSIGSLERKPLSLVEALGLGMLLAMTFLLREGAFVLSALLLIPLAARIVSTKVGRLKSVVCAVLFFLPLILASQAYQSWNEYRTGERFVTTGGQTAYLQGLADAARRAPRVFSGQDDLDRIARKVFSDYSFSEVMEVSRELHRAGYRAPQIAELTKEKYFHAWIEYPVPMFRMAVRHLRESYAFLAFRPLAAARETGFWSTGERPWPNYGDLKSGGIGAKVVFGLETAERVVGIVLTLVFLVAPIIWGIHVLSGKGGTSSHKLVWLSLWLVYLGFLCAHAMVHIEPRYLMPVLPFSILIGCVGLQPLIKPVATKLRVLGPNIR